MNIDYIANVRLPTYKAHGVQITKMCEQFAILGCNVQLIVPAKKHTIGGSADLFDYYRLERNFTFIRMRCLDLLGLTTAFGTFFYWIDLLSFLFALTFTAHIREDAILYARDPLLLLPFSRKRHKLCVEVHDIPTRGGVFLHLLKRADVVVALTTLLKDDLIKRGVAAGKIIVAGDAVDLKEFQNPEPQETARRRLGLPQEAKIAMYIGRLDGWKGVDTLCETAALLPQDIRIAVVGGEDKELVELKKFYPDVLFVGPRPYTELANNQAAADVLVLPNTAKNVISARFTSPLKLFTYMTAGRPIVASDLPSIREVLDENTAILVEPDNPRAFAEGVKKILNDKIMAEKLSSAAKIKVGEYTWVSRAKRILTALT